MAKYSINDTTLTNIAAYIRMLMKSSDGLTPEEMAAQLDSVNGYVSAALEAVAAKGVTVPDDAGVAALAELVDALPDKTETVLETWVFTLEDGSTVEKEVEVSA